MRQFHEYSENALYTNNTPEAIMLNGHTVFLIANKNDNTKDKRMQWVVNNYTDYDNVDKRPYYEYYKNNIADDYNEYEVCEMLDREPTPFMNKTYEDDVDIHYRELGNKYVALAKLNERLQRNETPEIIEPFEESIAESTEYQSSLEYDDLCSEGYDEYCEKCLDNEQFEDDDYDY